MFPEIRDVLALLEKLAPVHLAEPWDNPGLQVGSYSQEITKIFMALDPTLKAVQSAIDRKAQLLLTHHPLIFKPASHIDINAYPGNVVAEAVKNRLSVIAIHTNLDVAAGGINDILADLLGLQNVEVLKEVVEAKGNGLGRIGDLPAMRMLRDMVQDVQTIFGIERPRLIARNDIKVHRVAIVGGSGGELVSLAAKKGAELLITGDVSHHHALEATSLGMALIDAGHFNTEKTAFKIFGEHLKGMIKDIGWTIEVEADENEIDPKQEGPGIF